MSRTLNRLTAREVATMKTTGRHADGGGLYLRITAAGARSWVFMTSVDGKRSEIGLGPAAAVPLATARRIASEMREAAATGANPRSVSATKTAQAAPTIVTFGAFAESYISDVEDGWKNAVHRQQWRNSLRDHAATLQDIRVDEVTTDHVLAVLRPIWLTKAETARRVRGRIEKILDAAKARQLRPRDALNPAQLKGHLSLLLPSQSKVERGHHAALPYGAAPAFMLALRARPAAAARCLEFVILTAARSGEALGADWREIDFGARTWTVPAERMKAGAEHIVPLSDAVIAVLDNQRAGRTSSAGSIFRINGARQSNMAMAMLLRRMGYGNITTHGFRSTFRDWAGDETDSPRELIEQALAHTIQNKAERAYRRGTAIERRRTLMEAWAEFLNSKFAAEGD